MYTEPYLHIHSIASFVKSSCSLSNSEPTRAFTKSSVTHWKIIFRCVRRAEFKKKKVWLKTFSVQQALGVCAGVLRSSPRRRRLPKGVWQVAFCSKGHAQQQRSHCVVVSHRNCSVMGTSSSPRWETALMWAGRFLFSAHVELPVAGLPLLWLYSG